MFFLFTLYSVYIILNAFCVGYFATLPVVILSIGKMGDDEW
jgi:hypothetical protein